MSGQETDATKRGGAKGPRILIVDDEPEILKVLKRALRTEGFDVTETTEPTRALELLASEPWDILISDIDMPLINGYEVVKQARELCPEAIRILITGAGTMEGAIRAINEGEVHRYVPKPFTMAHIRRLVTEALGRKVELGRVVKAEQQVVLKKQVRQRFVSQYPGIDDFDRDDEGIYIVDPVGTARKAAILGLSPLLSLEGH